MKYMGAKSRIAKYIVPLMVKAADEKGITQWVEPFVGGGNLIDKVPSRFTRVGTDANPHVIAALKDIREHPDKLPEHVSEEEYKAMLGRPPESITSWVRFVCAFSGQFESGYAKDKTERNYAAEGKRNALKQSPHLHGVALAVRDYRQAESLTASSLIYCDPPYKGTSGYKTGEFNHDEFYAWCEQMADKHIVFVSEYVAPEQWDVVYEKEQICNLNNVTSKATQRVEKLFRVKREA